MLLTLLQLTEVLGQPFKPPTDPHCGLAAPVGKGTFSNSKPLCPSALVPRTTFATAAAVWDPGKSFPL